MFAGRDDSSLLCSLPQDISIQAIPRAIGSLDDAIQFMAKLSCTCTQLHSLFQQPLEKRLAEKLLSCVLKPTTANLEIAKKLYTINPQLLFIEATAEEYAAGFVTDLAGNLKNIPRKVKASPIRAMAGCGDAWLLKEVINTKEFQEYVDPESKKFACDLAIAEIKKQFPNGFAFPASDYDYGNLLDLMAKDQSLNQNNELSEETKNLLADFRKRFFTDIAPDNGHFFNLIEVENAAKMFHTAWEQNNHSYHVLSLFWRQVVGYLNGLVTGVEAQMLSQKCVELIENANAVPIRKYVLDMSNWGRDCFYFPLSDDPDTRLGLAFGAEIDQLGCRLSVMGGDYPGLARVIPLYFKFVRTNIQKHLADILQQLEQQSALRHDQYSKQQSNTRDSQRLEESQSISRHDQTACVIL